MLKPETIAFVLFGILLLPLPSFAFTFKFSGARSMALGHANTTLHDLWSGNNNPAGLITLTHFSIAGAYQNRMGLSELNLSSLQMASPIKKGVIGISLQRFGFSEYSENKLGLSYALKLSNRTSIGVQLNYISIQIAEPTIPAKHGGFAQIGFQSELTENLILGIHIVNLLNNGLSGEQNEKLSSQIIVGLQYHFSKKLIVLFDLDKNSELPPNLKIGMEHHPTENLYFRAGYQSLYQNLSAGFGLNLGQLQLNIAFANQPFLGWKSEISLGYRLSRP